MTRLIRRRVRERSLATYVRVWISLCGAALSVGCDGSRTSIYESPLLRERFLAGRLAHQTQWRACEQEDSTALIVKTRCGSSPKLGDPGFEELASGASATGASSIDSIRASALIDLRWHDQSPAGLDRAIASLEEVVRRAPTDSVALNDLAVAYLAQAERDQQLGPLLRSLDAIERAQAVNTEMPAVLFNRALILERLKLVESAQRAWKRYLTIERKSAWRDEARERLQSLEAFAAAGVAATPMPETLLTRNVDSARRDVALLSRRTPQWGRESGFAFLGAWGSALMAGDSTRAAFALSLARSAAEGLHAPGRDQSLARAIAVLDAQRDRSLTTRSLARGHAAYMDGYAQYARGQYDHAVPLFAGAERDLRAGGSPAAQWAALYNAVARLNRGELPDSIVQRVLATTVASEPALEGKAIWVQGLNQVRHGAYELAIQTYREAVNRYQSTGETENLGMLANLLAEALEFTGQRTASHAETLRSLSLLPVYRNSPFLSNQLAVVANQARAIGLHRTAIAVLGEVLADAVRPDRPNLLVWAGSERAQHFLAIADPDSARSELTAANRALERMDAGTGRDLIGAGLLMAQAQLIRTTDPRAARDQLTRVVDVYRATNNETQSPNALYQMALAARDARDTAMARRALEQAVTGIETRRSLFGRLEVRASFYETMEAVFDAVIALEYDAGRAAEAFKYLERARAASWANTAPRAVEMEEVQRHLTPGVVMLEYAVLADRIVVWSIRHDTWSTRQIRISRDSVAALATRFDAESDQATVRDGGARAQLFDLLTDSTTRGASALIVVPDRELSTIPFAALWNRRRSRYLIEDAAVRTLPSAAFVAASSAPNSVRHRLPAVAVIVGDPAFDSVAMAGVKRLPGAAREAASVADLYPGGILLTDAGAQRDSAISLLRNATVFHFAGHAISNLDQPELSYLAFAASPNNDGLLRAREIAAMRLSNLNIVVLSGCSTLGARPTHVGTLAGLAYSFLRARAPAIVSTLWDVDDDATTPLLVAFHKHLASGVSAAEALRSAQREALRSPTATLQAPRAWAAFVYTGP